jgi:hypothetical protein
MLVELVFDDEYSVPILPAGCDNRVTTGPIGYQFRRDHRDPGPAFEQRVPRTGMTCQCPAVLSRALMNGRGTLRTPSP